MRSLVLSVGVCVMATIYFVTKETPLTSINHFIDIDEVETASLTSMTYFPNTPSYTYQLTAEEVAELKEMLKQVKLRRTLTYEEQQEKHFLIIQTKYDNEILTLTADEQLKIGFDHTYNVTNDVLQIYFKKIAENYQKHLSYE